MVVNGYQKAAPDRELSPLKNGKDNRKAIKIEMMDSESPVRASRAGPARKVSEFQEQHQPHFKKLEVNILDEMKNGQEEEPDEGGDIETECQLD